MNKIILAACFALILFSSCINQEMSPRKSFKLDIGFRENEVGLFFNTETLAQENINIFYRSGFYYISDPKNKKILKITENGLNVLTIYNAETNPHFKQTNSVSFNQEKNEKEKIVYMKNYKEYPLHTPSLITVDIEKNIYVVDTLPNTSTIKNNFTQKSVILKFDNDGNFLNLIGDEKTAVKPFTSILKIITDSNNNLVVMEKNEEGNYFVNKISPTGEHLKTVNIQNDSLPLTSKEKESNYKADIINIFPSYNENDLIVTIQYGKEVEEPITKTYSQKTFEFLYDKIYKYSIKNEKFSKQILKLNPKTMNISKIDKKSNIADLYGDKTSITKPMENLQGSDSNDYLYFSQLELPINDIKDYKKRFYVYDGKGSLKRELVIKFPNTIQYASDFYVSPEGKVYYFFVDNGVIQFASFNY